jgi:predicted ATPase
MGVVYEAFDRESAERIALKSLRSLSPRALRALKNEFRTVAEIVHPNLVSLGELIEDDGRWYLTMELVDGVNFLQYVSAGPWAPQTNDETVPHPGSGASNMEPERTMAITTTGAQQSGRSPGVLATSAPRALQFDERRLRACLEQLVRGLRALHNADRVHCDIKPSNIVVTPNGRLVLLDFGLAVPSGARLSEDGGRLVTGSIHYMSPEHAAGRPVHAASDWYSAGVVLFEALTGLLPHLGDRRALLKSGLNVEPPSPRELVPDVPEDLSALCTGLLHAEPHARPTGAELELRVPAGPEAPRLALASGFIGRGAELAELKLAFERTCLGENLVVVVEGESGLGKSALVDHFVRQLRTSASDTWVVSGRCFARESVPYKAFDGLLDELSHRLLELPREELVDLLPPSLPVIAKTFVVLADLPGADGPYQQPVDPKELQTQLFVAIRDLLTLVAKRHSLVLVINDLHWSDDDSLALLREVLRSPDAPPLLCLVTSRSEVTHATLADGGARVLRLRLEGLTASESEQLVRTTLDATAQASELERMIAESQGHPMFLRELVRDAQRTAQRHESAGTLDQALHARIALLEELPRRLLTLSALNGQPLAQEILAKAAEVDMSAFREAAQVLRSQQLAQTTGRRLADTLEPYHDRIRETAIAHLSPAARQDLHRALAIAIEARGASGCAQLLAVHYEGAGERQKAAKYYRAAADEARDALSFALAASFYRKVQLLEDSQVAAKVELCAKLAEALVHAGASAESIPEFLRAAALSEIPSVALEMKRRAMEQMLRIGNTDGGTVVLNEILNQAGTRVPEPKKAVKGLRWARLRLKLRGTRYTERPEEACSPEALRRIDLYWSATIGFFYVNPVIGFYFNSKSLLECLKVGEPVRATRALALYVFARTALGEPWPRVDAYADAVWAKASALGDKSAMVWCDYSHAFAAFDHGQYGRALELTARAEHLLVSACTGMELELSYIRWVACRTMALAGEWGELARLAPMYVRQAEERGDRMTTMMLSGGLCSFGWLASDRPVVARALTEVSLRGWSGQTFRSEHVIALWARSNIDVYEGKVQDGFECIEKMWTHFSEARMDRQKSALYLVTQQRAICALALAAAKGSSAPSHLLELVGRCVQVMRKYPGPSQQGEALLIEAGLAHQRQGKQPAVALLRSAIAALTKGNRKMLAAAARWRLGELIGGEEGERLASSGRQFMQSQSIAKPRSVLALVSPGF